MTDRQGGGGGERGAGVAEGRRYQILEERRCEGEFVRKKGNDFLQETSNLFGCYSGYTSFPLLFFSIMFFFFFKPTLMLKNQT